MSKEVIRVGTAPLTPKNIIELNSKAQNSEIIVEIENTKGQDSDLIKKLSKDITISILGGLNYEKKDKYNEERYRNRTFYTPRQVSNIIKTFENIERKIDPTWSQLEKAMYVYKVFVENLNYNNNEREVDGKGEFNNRNLLVLKTRKGVCAGFGLVYKEAMDRLGIPCDYQNKARDHVWNVLKIDDKYIPIDLTYDISAKEANQDGKCHFKHFGTNQDFYSDKHHNIYDDQDETMYEITTIPEEVLRDSYQKIITNRIHKAPIKEQVLNNQKVKYAMEQLGDKVICLYGVDNNINLNYYDENNHLKTFSNSMINHNDDDITLPKYRVFKRNDNTTFCIVKDESKEGSYLYCDFDNKENVYRSYKIYSESDLINPKTRSEEITIANNLLGENRLLRKVEHFNGYVGFVKDDRMFYDKDFEKEELNIVNRK